MSRVPHFDLILLLAIVVAVVVLLVATLSTSWVGEVLAGVLFVLTLVRWFRRRRTA